MEYIILMHISINISTVLEYIAWISQCIWSQIDNREIASVILLFGFVVLAAVKGNSKSILRSFADVAACVFKPQIVVPVLILIANSCLVFRHMAQIHLWSIDMLQDSIIEVIAVGFPALYNAVESHTVKSVFKRVVVPEINLSALAAFYINIETFSLPVELAVQFILTLLIFARAVCSRKPREKKAVHQIDCLLSAISLLMFVVVTCMLIHDWNKIDWSYEMTALFMSLWYPVSVLPFLILLGYYSALEKMCHRIRAVSRDIRLSELLFFAFEMFPSLCCISHFTACEARQCLETRSFGEKHEYCNRFKQQIKVKASEANDKIARMEAGKGKRGFDANGLWLDWESLEKIKSALWTVASLQNSEWKRLGSYSSSVKNDMVSIYCPAGCKSGGYISDDGSVYICWMSNGTGFTFGMGASNGEYPPQMYEGERPPLIDSGKPLAEFIDEAQQDRLPNWHASFYVDESYQ